MGDFYRGVYPPTKGLQAHAQVPRHDPVPLNTGNERVQPVQQQPSHSRLSQVFDAALQPALEQVRVIGTKGCNQICQQEQGDAGVLEHWSDVTA